MEEGIKTISQKELVTEHACTIRYIVQQDKSEVGIANDLRAYVRIWLYPNPQLYYAVNKELARQGVMTPAQLRAYLSLVLEI